MRTDIEPNLSALPSDGKLLRLFLPAVLAVSLGLGLGGCAVTEGGGRVKDTTRTFQTVVIDAGHGGHDGGAKSKWGGQEKNNTLDVARRLSSKLQAAGFRTVMTRSSDNFVGLNERAAISNQQQNAVFVSIHFNDSRKRKIRGTEVYYRSAVSAELAQRILAKVGSLPGASRRFVQTANYRVLKLSEFPAVLVECGYLSHRGEGSLCASGTHHERIAGAIAQALVEQKGRAVPTASPAVATTQTAR